MAAAAPLSLTHSLSSTYKEAATTTCDLKRRERAIGRVSKVEESRFTYVAAVAESVSLSGRAFVVVVLVVAVTLQECEARDAAWF